MRTDAPQTGQLNTVKNSTNQAIPQKMRKTNQVKKIIGFFLLVFAMFGVYALWLFGPIKLDIELDTPIAINLQIFYSDKEHPKWNKHDTKAKYVLCGKNNKVSFIIFQKKIKKLRIGPGSVGDIKLKISKIRISQGFISREISFLGKKAADISKEKNLFPFFNQLKYWGNGDFLTTGPNPYFCINVKNIPKKKSFPICIPVLITALALMILFLEKTIRFIKLLHGRIEVMADKIKFHANQLLPSGPFLLYALIVILLGWGFEFFNYIFMYDDELIFHEFSATGWVTQGRWGMALIALLSGNPIVPVIPRAITLFCYGLSFLILFPSRCLDKYYIFPIYAVFPILYHSFSFSSLNPGIGIAFLLSALAVYLVNKRSKICFLLAILFSSFAIGTYEAFAVYIPIALVSHWLFCGLKHDFYCRFKYIRYFACKCILLAAGSFLLHKIILYICYNIYHIKNGNFISKNYLCPIADFSIWLNWVSDKILRIYSGSGQLFPKEMIFQLFAICFSLLLIGTFIFCKKRILWHKFLLFTGLIFLVFAPFTPYVFHQYAGVPIRVITLLVPLSLVSIFHLALVVSRPYRYLKLIMIGLLIFISIQYLWNLNQNTYLNYLQNKRDMLVVAKIQNRINEIPEFALKSAYEKKIPVLAIGGNKSERIILPPILQRQSYPNWEGGLVGASCLGRFRSLISMMKIYCYRHYTCAYTFAKNRLSMIENMPMWPLNGSIAFHGDCLIIKFSDFLPSASKKLNLNRKLLHISPFLINGLEELTATKTDKMRLLHTYKVSALKDPKVKAEGSVAALNLKNTNRRITFPPRKFDVPYVVLEITAEYDQADTFSLWCNHWKQIMQFSFKAGENHLKVRCPSFFLNKPFQIGLGTNKVKKVLLKDIKVFDDAQYTENLIKLNPELTPKKLMEMLHE